MERITIVRDEPWTPDAWQLSDMLRLLLGVSWHGELRIGENRVSASAGSEDVVLASMHRARDRDTYRPTVAELVAGPTSVRLEHEWTEVADLGRGLIVVAERAEPWGDDQAARGRALLEPAMAFAERGDDPPLRLHRAWISPAEAQRVWGDHLRAVQLMPGTGYVVLSGADGASEESAARELAELIRLVRSGGSPARDAELRRRSSGPAGPAHVPAPIERPSYLQDTSGTEGNKAGCSACESLPSGPADETAALDVRSVVASLAGGALPFGGTTSRTRLAALRKPASSEAEAPTDADETMALPTALLRDALRGADFATRLREVSFPELGIDHYAALQVELELKGAEPGVLRRYGIATPAVLDALHREQERRMAAAPALRARFEERRAHFMRFARKP